MSILKLTSDTLVGSPSTGNIEYNGQFFGTDSNNSRAQMQRIVQATATTSASGTSIDFTGIPSWAKKISIMFNGVSTNGTSNPLIQLGTSSGATTTGYVCNSMSATTAVGVATFTSGFGLRANSAANALYGVIQILNLTGNTWNGMGVLNLVGAEQIYVSGGVILGGTLDRVRITTVNGTDSYDAGSINIIYEG